jgi:L-threonylcarbamoyladenylate synthase
MVMLAASAGDMERAAGALRRGGIVAFPTETVYGLGADAFNPQALARVFEVKGRPRFDPLIIHIASLEALPRIARLEALAAPMGRILDLLISRFWPGPLTLILPKRLEVPDLATSGLPSAAVRFPSHPVARDLILRSTGALAAPSANRFGGLSPTLAEHVREDLGEGVDFIIDGGPAALGLESTVLDLCPSGGGRPRILRPGGVPREEIEALVGPLAEKGPAAGEALPSPGLMKSHYAPRTPLLLHGTEEMAALPCLMGEGYLFFSGGTRARWEARNGTVSAGAATRTLSEGGVPSEAAAGLFAVLHGMDALGLGRIHAEAAPERGLGRAINDRLDRASGSRTGNSHSSAG